MAKYFFEKKATSGLYLWTDDDGGGGANSNWSSTASPTYTATTKPANGDTVTITAATTCTYDEDMSAWSNGVTLTINGTMNAITTASSYLKCQANLTVNGTLRAGTSVAVPLPFATKFTIYLNGNYTISVAAAGKLYLYCTEPAIKYVKLSGAEAAGQTELSVDTDITGDIWADGDTIRIDDVAGTLPDSEARVIAAGGRAAGTITITAGLTAAKASGSYIFLITRNIKITGSTGYAVTFNTASTGCYVGAEISGCTSGIFFGYNNSVSGTISGCVSAINNTRNTNLYGIISGSTYGTNVGLYNIIYGVISGCNYGNYQGIANLMSYSGIITGCTSGINLATSPIVNGSVINNSYGIIYGTGHILINCILSNTNDLFKIFGGIAYNVDFGLGTEFSGYNADDYRSPFTYFESINHDQVANAFKVWCLGGIVTSQTGSPPTGYTMWYAHACESATYPCFRQYQYTVAPNETLVVTGKMRIPNATDMSANPPKFQIIDFFADPLMDVTQVPLSTMSIPVSNGTNTDWQDMSIAWTNTGESPRLVYIRTTATHATQQVDECVYVPDINAQISTIYTKLPMNYIMGSSDQDDHDNIADAVWDEPLTGETHNDPTSAGRRLRNMSIQTLVTEGEVQAVDSLTITLEEEASDQDDFYNNCKLIIIQDELVQSRLIVDYDGGDRIITIARAWTVTPEEGDEYQIQIDELSKLSNNGADNVLDDISVAVREEMDSNSTQLIDIKERTDNLPDDPADQSDVEAAITAAHSTTDGKIDVVNSKIVHNFNLYESV